jgi:hypothetical protein
MTCCLKLSEILTVALASPATVGFFAPASVTGTKRRLCAASDDRRLVLMLLTLVVLRGLAEPLHSLPRVQLDARIDEVQLEIGQLHVAPRLSSSAFSKIQAVAQVRHYPRMGGDYSSRSVPLTPLPIDEWLQRSVPIVGRRLLEDRS